MEALKEIPLHASILHQAYLTFIFIHSIVIHDRVEVIFEFIANGFDFFPAHIPFKSAKVPAMAEPTFLLPTGVSGRSRGEFNERRLVNNFLT